MNLLKLIHAHLCHIITPHIQPGLGVNPVYTDGMTLIKEVLDTSTKFTSVIYGKGERLNIGKSSIMALLGL